MRIYKITDLNETEVYIGSTSQMLSQRMSAHRFAYRNWKNDPTIGYCSSYAIFDKYGIENCRIILLEEVQTDSKEALRAVEHRYISQMACVNKNSAIPLTGERLKEYNREYRDKHREKINNYQQKYRTQHREDINARAKGKVQCECGSEVAYSAQSRHRQTQKHQRLLGNITLATTNGTL